MKTIWNDQDIIIVNNIRVLNKDATVRFYEMYKDKFVNPIDVDKQLFTEEWAIKVIENENLLYLWKTYSRLWK